MVQQEKIFFTKYNVLFFSVMLNLGFIGKMSAQNNSEKEQEYKINKTFFKQAGNDYAYIFTHPVTRKGKGLIKLSAALAGITTLYFYDEKIRNIVQKNRNNSTDNTANFFEAFGSGKYSFIPVAALLTYGYTFNNNKARKAAILSLESFALANILTQTLKYSIHRERPDARAVDKVLYPQSFFYGPQFSQYNVSFPSGHTTAAFSIASVISSVYKKTIWVPVLCYTTAAMVGWSRMNSNRHWASDVFAGAAIGFLSGKSIVKIRDSRYKNKLSFFPNYIYNTSGVCINYIF